jgi:hypothetical protein
MIGALLQGELSREVTVRFKLDEPNIERRHFVRLWERVAKGEIKVNDLMVKWAKFSIEVEFANGKCTFLKSSAKTTSDASHKAEWMAALGSSNPYIEFATGKVSQDAADLERLMDLGLGEHATMDIE